MENNYIIIFAIIATSLATFISRFFASSKAFKKRKPRKEPIHIQRDIAEGRAFNNSFTGPYPEETDHLHNDKGPNP